jgi:hypothetical protein
MNAKFVGKQEKETQAGRRSVVVHIVSNTQNSSKSRPLRGKKKQAAEESELKTDTGKGDV